MHFARAIHRRSCSYAVAKLFESGRMKKTAPSSTLSVNQSYGLGLRV